MDVNQVNGNENKLHQTEQTLKTAQVQQAEQAAEAQKNAEPKNDAYSVTLSPESQKLAEAQAQQPEKMLERGEMV